MPLLPITSALVGAARELDAERTGVIVARMGARHGAPSIEDYRRVAELLESII